MSTTIIWQWLELDVNHLTELYLPCPRSNRRSIYFHNEKKKKYYKKKKKKVTGPGRKSAWLIDADIYKGISPLTKQRMVQLTLYL